MRNPTSQQCKVGLLLHMHDRPQRRAHQGAKGRPVVAVKGRSELRVIVKERTKRGAIIVVAAAPTASTTTAAAAAAAAAATMRWCGTGRESLAAKVSLEGSLRHASDEPPKAQVVVPLKVSGSVKEHHRCTHATLTTGRSLAAWHKNMWPQESHTATFHPRCTYAQVSPGLLVGRAFSTHPLTWAQSAKARGGPFPPGRPQLSSRPLVWASTCRSVRTRFHPSRTATSGRYFASPSTLPSSSSSSSASLPLSASFGASRQASVANAGQSPLIGSSRLKRPCRARMWAHAAVTAWAEKNTKKDSEGEIEDYESGKHNCLAFKRSCCWRL